MAKVFDSINEKYAEKIFAEKIDISKKPELASEYNVKYVPHLLFVDEKGEVFKQEIGFMQEADVLLAFEKAGIVIK
jgi:thioredoxin-related protein